MGDAILAARNIVTAAVDLALAPASSLPGAWPLIWLSVVSGFLLALIFKILSRPAPLAAMRRRMGGTTSGILLHMHDPVAVLVLGGRLLAQNFRYLLLLMPPLVVSAVPFMLLYGQVHSRFGAVAPGPGDTTLVVIEGLLQGGSGSASAEGAAVLEPGFRSGDGSIAAFRIVPSGFSFVVAYGGSRFHFGTPRRTGALVSSSVPELGLTGLFDPSTGVAPGTAGLRAEMSAEKAVYPVFRTRPGAEAVFVAVSSLAALAAGVLFKVKV